LAARSEPEETVVTRTMAELDLVFVASVALGGDVPFFDALVAVNAAARVCAGAAENRTCFEEPEHVVAFARRCDELPWPQCRPLQSKAVGANVTTTYDGAPATLLSFRRAPLPAKNVVAKAKAAASHDKENRRLDDHDRPEDRNGRLVFSHELQFST